MFKLRNNPKKDMKSRNKSMVVGGPWYSVAFPSLQIAFVKG
jgi:hypothetical protein